MLHCLMPFPKLSSFWGEALQLVLLFQTSFAVAASVLDALHLTTAPWRRAGWCNHSWLPVS